MPRAPEVTISIPELDKEPEAFQAVLFLKRGGSKVDVYSFLNSFYDLHTLFTYIYLHYLYIYISQLKKLSTGKTDCSRGNA